MARNLRFTRCLILSIIVVACLIQPVEAKFINTFLYRIGGSSLSAGDEKDLAKHSIIFCQTFHYDDIRGNTWQAIKSINPNSKIYLYTTTTFVNRDDDSVSALYLNNLGRYNASRGHSMGSLNGNNGYLFLLDKNGNRVRWSWDNRPMYWLDFGNSNLGKYAAEATVKDHANQPWTADGVYSDNVNFIGTNTSATPVKYNTQDKWAAAMRGMILSMSSGLHARGLKFAGNAGPTSSAIGANAWLAMDSSANAPDALLEEGAFAVRYGTGDIQFYPESTWLRQVDLLGSLNKINACFMTSCEIAPGQSGSDNYGKSFSFYDALWYSLGSYLVGKNDRNNNSYFQFYHSQAHYNTESLYYDEYGIDLGKAVGDYRKAVYGGKNLYWREFEKGYVYVNPTTSDVSSISLPKPCKQLTHSNLKTSPDSLPDVASINLKSHRAAILYKSNSSSSSAGSGSSGNDIIIDNGGTGTSSTGTWNLSNGSNYYGSKSLYSSQAGSNYTYQASADGSYDVLLWWTQLPSRDPSVPVRIYAGGTHLDTLYINQKEEGGRWNYLGTYQFNGNARIVVESEDGNSTCADAVKISPASSADEIIIDNLDQSSVSSTGTWKESGSSNEWKGSSFYGRDGATFRFHFDCPETGRYEVLEWHSPWSSRSSNVLAKVEHDGSATSTNKTINQTIGGNTWNPLGNFNYTAGRRYTITIVSQPGPSSTSADAVKFRLN